MTDDEWRIDDLDLDAYLARIGAAGGEPSPDTLVRLHGAHVAAIPFENLDLVLGRPVRVDLAAVQDKLVRRQRGGYCYEHGVLFAAVLQRLGFAVERLLARIGHDPVRPRPRTHMTLHVTAHDGTQWLADVGFGAALLAPIVWDGAQPHRQGGWTYRLISDQDGTRQLQEQNPDGWTPLYSFNTEPQHASDVEMANHFTSTHPSSPFLQQPIAMRRDPGSRTRLHGHRLETTRPDHPPQARDVAAEELSDVARDVFGIRLDPADVARLASTLPDPA